MISVDQAVKELAQTDEASGPEKITMRLVASPRMSVGLRRTTPDGGFETVVLKKKSDLDGRFKELSPNQRKGASYILSQALDGDVSISIMPNGKIMLTPAIR